ncbi:LysM peptidoglycan-binding domain-containing protein [Halochromatium salexigens]|uniref:LysM domain-containing protein n=1 Tax=Halochromatium salexigens TaxID=49447 RepID=A0AAJ0XFQ6_HALSE|nr:LysM domain-containing protein [Halochromatium salexigens]MBK5931259.1 hypothetical protein [Halochromatium salexigens]
MVLVELVMTACSPLLAAPAASAPVALQPNAPEVYQVRPGDSLWGIAGRFLRDPWRWPEIWEGNPEVADPNLIYPGDRLLLDTSRPSRPRVRHATAASDGMRVMKLSPRVRITTLDAAVPTIPIDAIEPFLSRSWVADSRALEEAPSVVGFPRERLLVATGDRLFVRPIHEAPADRYEILRPGEALRDPVTQDVLGYPARFVAEARLGRAGDPAVLLVTNAIMPVRRGDRVRPLRSDTVALRPFLPRPAPAGLKGHLIAVLDDVTRIGQYDHVVLDRGARQGVESGQVFAVYDGGEVSDGGAYSVPDSQVGIILVFRVFERVSVGLVMRAHQALRVGQRVAAPHGH